MNKLILTTLVFAAVSTAVVPPVTDNNAGISCNAWAIVPNTADVTANCQDTSGTFHGARISISTCVVNEDGNLSCRNNGGAGSTCILTNIAGTLGNAVVNVDASCLEDDGNRNTVTNFNIGACLTNDDGELTC
ncbi:hypothetical protein B0H10DRAFT_1804474 [Mycena sp. CBHHK59/15]|nr:hypothetical protein B0H10DRAFT_1804474 [Mycena sp. CBHHK59/15]